MNNPRFEVQDDSEILKELLKVLIKKIELYHNLTNGLSAKFNLGKDPNSIKRLLFSNECPVQNKLIKNIVTLLEDIFSLSRRLENILNKFPNDNSKALIIVMFYPTYKSSKELLEGFYKIHGYVYDKH